MVSLVRWRPRSYVNHGVDAYKTNCGPKKRRSRHATRWPARTAFDWLVYTNRQQSLRVLRRMRVHVDTSLRTSDGFHEKVHWQVISALCPKLLDDSTVRTDLLDANKTERYHSVELPQCITQEMAGLIVACAYGEPELALNRANLEEFYDIATKYDIDHAIGACLDYALTILDVNNCIYLFELSIEHKHQKLRRAAYAMIRACFRLILRLNNDFHQLSARHLKQILLDDSLRINEDEEIAWLAIVRWSTERQMSQAELARLYNQMMSEPRRLWLSNYRQQPSTSRQTQGQFQSQTIRLTLDFYSPANPIETNEDACYQTKTGVSRNKSPLRSAADSVRGRRVAGPVSDREDDLYQLVKCLRFMRFKSPGAFDVILESPIIAPSTRLTLLVHHMRLRYKLRHKIPLSPCDKRLMAPQELSRLRDYETNKVQRIIKSVGKFVRSTLQPALPSGVAPPQANQSLADIQDAFDDQQQHQIPDRLANGLTLELVNEQLSAKSLQRATRPRIPTSVGFLIGGWQDGSVTDSIWAYDFVFDKWFKLNIKLPEARAYHASCSSPKGQVYVFGGTDGKTILRSVLRLHPASDVFVSSASSAAGQRKRVAPQKLSGMRDQSHKGVGNKFLWSPSPQAAKLVYNFKKLCPMNEGRCHLSGLFHSDGRLYALGGHSGTQRLRSGEWYDSNSNQWRPIADMTIARADAAACSHDNKIFIAGGQISDQFIQSSVEFYKSSDNTWTFAAPMIIPRMSFSLASYKGHLLAIGGTNGMLGGEEVASVTRSVERYNHNTGAWSFCAPLIRKRCSFGVMQIENKLLVMGGFGGRGRVKTCESLRIGHFTSQPSLGVSLATLMTQQRLSRLATAMGRNEPLADQGATGGPLSVPDSEPGTSEPTISSENVQATRLPRRVEPAPQRRASASRNSVPNLTTTHAATQLTANEFMRAPNGAELSLPVGSAMKWIPRANLPERRSGFSIAVVNKLRNAKDFTYFGSIGLRNTTCTGGDRGTSSRVKRAPKPSFIKQPGRWHKFKIIKRRKLVKHLKIALIVTIVILMM